MNDLSGFDADWLRLREPFDAAARDNDLARGFGAAFGTGRREGRRIIDLAAGTGANFRALAPRLDGDQDWLLVDHDPMLIAAQAAEIARWSRAHGWHCRTVGGGVEVDSGSSRWRARARTLDLARDLEAIVIAGCDAVTATAFLDLVSSAWLDRLCSLLARRRLPMLATLTVDGRREWHPPLPADARIDEAFRRHQAGDKGFGPAQGEQAASYLASRLVARGYTVATARSDWRITTAHHDMLVRLIDESTAVACATDPGKTAVFVAWSAERHRQARAGLLALHLGHVDILATPSAGESAWRRSIQAPPPART